MGYYACKRPSAGAYGGSLSGVLSANVCGDRGCHGAAVAAACGMEGAGQEAGASGAPGLQRALRGSTDKCGADVPILVSVGGPGSQQDVGKRSVYAVGMSDGCV